MLGSSLGTDRDLQSKEHQREHFGSLRSEGIVLGSFGECLGCQGRHLDAKRTAVVDGEVFVAGG